MIKKIKLLHVITGLGRGGAEGWLVELIKILKDKRYEHAVIFFYEGPHQEVLRALGVPLYRVKGVLGAYDPFAWWRFYRCVKKINPDLIHSSLWLANLYCRIVAFFLGRPCVQTIHQPFVNDSWLQNRIDCVTFFLATHVVAISHTVARSLELVLYANCVSLTVIPHGIDAARFELRARTVAKKRSELGLADDHFVIGTVGRFVAVKNQLLLIEAFACLVVRYPHARLLLVGHGPLEGQLRRAAQQHGVADCVTFIIDEPAISYYSVMDCFVLPSLCEGFGLVLLEAFVLQVPCIALAYKGAHPVIEHEKNGLLFFDDAPESLRITLSRLVGNSFLKEDLTAYAYDQAHNLYTMGRMKKRYEILYRNLLMQKSKNCYGS